MSRSRDPLSAHHRPSTSVDVDNAVARQYVASLRSTDLGSVPILELLHTLFGNPASTSAATFSDAISHTNRSGDVYRDAAGTLVVRHPEEATARLDLLWPVGERTTCPTESTTIVGCHGDVFLADDTSGDVVPLPAAAAGHCGYDWGSTSTAVANLYLAIVFTVSGHHAPRPARAGAIIPNSLYGWLVRHDRHRDLDLPWPYAARLVAEDEPLRRVANAATRRTRTGSSAPTSLFSPPAQARTGTIGEATIGEATIGKAQRWPAATMGPVASSGGVTLEGVRQ